MKLTISLALLLTSAHLYAASNCSATKMTELLERASDAKPSIELNCNAQLSSSSVTISKKIVIKGSAASGLVLDCKGGSINPTSSKGGSDSITVRSVKASDGSWSRPENITIRNCIIQGSVRMWGMAATHSEDILQSSRSLGHTARMQNAAPRNITLDRIKIIGKGRIPLYLSMGVSYSSLLNSEISGVGTSTAIYFDAESAYNTLKNNYIHVVTTRREQLAIDGSAYNRIISNRFAAINNGGIYVYRNCGERQVIRHQAPQHNQFINNVFYYNRYNGGNPALWLGSRNTFWRDTGTFFHIGFCHDDDGYNFGSSKSDEDYAKYNIVAENQIYKRSVSDVIKQNYSPNYYYYNRTVSSSIARKAGCYLQMGTQRHYLRHGDYFAARASTSASYGYKYTCNDNKISVSISRDLRQVNFDCQVTGNNNGCRRSAYCPAGKKLVSIKAACNLEYGAVIYDSLSSQTQNTLKVLRTSDRVSDGQCSITVAGSTTQMASGSTSLAPLLGEASALSAFCREQDRNGGDCHIKGQATCL